MAMSLNRGSGGPGRRVGNASEERELLILRVLTFEDHE